MEDEPPNFDPGTAFVYSNSDDIRTVVYYCIPLGELDRFRKTPTGQYRFSVERCEQEMESDGPIFKL